MLKKNEIIHRFRILLFTEATRAIKISIRLTMVITIALACTKAAIAAPDIPTRLSSPSGIDEAIQKTFRWRAIYGATWYQFYVSDGSRVFSRWYTADEASCKIGGDCWIRPESHSTVAEAIGASVGDKTWWIRAWNSTGSSGWSTGRRYYVGRLRYPGVVDYSIEPLGNRFSSPRTFFSFRERTTRIS